MRALPEPWLALGVAPEVHPVLALAEARDPDPAALLRRPEAVRCAAGYAAAQGDVAIHGTIAAVPTISRTLDPRARRLTAQDWAATVLAPVGRLGAPRAGPQAWCAAVYAWHPRLPLSAAIPLGAGWVRDAVPVGAHPAALAVVVTEAPLDRRVPWPGQEFSSDDLPDAPGPVPARLIVGPWQRPLRCAPRDTGGRRYVLASHRCAVGPGRVLVNGRPADVPWALRHEELRGGATLALLEFAEPVGAGVEAVVEAAEGVGLAARHPVRWLVEDLAGCRLGPRLAAWCDTRALGLEVIVELDAGPNDVLGYVTGALVPQLPLAAGWCGGALEAVPAALADRPFLLEGRAQQAGPRRTQADPEHIRNHVTVRAGAGLVRRSTEDGPAALRRRCRASQARFGLRGVTIGAPAVVDPAEAVALADWLATWLPAPAEAVDVRVPWGTGLILEPGDAVRWNGRVWLVVGWRAEPGSVLLTLEEVPA